MKASISTVSNSGQTAVGVNQTIIFNGVNFKVTKVSEQNSLQTFSPNGVFLLINMDIENIGKQSTNLADIHYKLVDASNRMFDVTIIRYASDYGLSGNNLNPGLKTTGNIVFDIPKGEQPANYKLAIGGSGRSPSVFIDVGSW